MNQAKNTGMQNMYVYFFNIDEIFYWKISLYEKNKNKIGNEQDLNKFL